MSGVEKIGSGLAAYTMAKDNRKLPPETPLRNVTADAGAKYSTPLLSNALAKGKTAETLPTATAAQMAEQLKAVITTHAHVTSIDTAAHTISTDHETVSYGQLVLCTGAEQLHAPLEGEAADTVLSVNGLADYAVFREALASAARVAIIGPGLIGCEFANALVGIGKHVAVIKPNNTPLGRRGPPAGGRAGRGARGGAGGGGRRGGGARRGGR